MEVKKYLQIFGILALSAMSNCTGNVKSVPTSSCQCQVVDPSRNILCSRHFGDSWQGGARFPNARGQGLGDASAEIFDYFYLIQLDNYCSHMLLNLLCFHYFPRCTPNSDNMLAVIPCREVCIEATEACIGYARKLIPDYTFPEHLNCSNFQPGVPECNVINGATSQVNSHCESCPSACPKPVPHVEFINTENLSGEEGGTVDVCLKLANVGSYNSSNTLNEDLSITITPCEIRDEEGYAQVGLDFCDLSIEAKFIKGTPKGEIICIEIPLFCDYIKEDDELFEVKVEVESGALFGGDFNNTQGSVTATITSKAPSPTPSSVINVATSSPIISLVDISTSSLVPFPTPQANFPVVEFYTNGTLCGEEGGTLRLYLRLVNVGSDNCNDTLDEDLCITITPCKLSDGHGYAKNNTAQPGLDFPDSHIYAKFPNGSSKGTVICIEIPLFSDNVKEDDEFFELKVEIESGALFQGGFNNKGSIIAKIINRAYCPTDITPTLSPTSSPTLSSVINIPTSNPSPSPKPTANIPGNECKANCNWRSRVAGRTLTNNEYTFAALVQIMRCDDAVMVVNVTRCVDIKCGKCPVTTPTILHIPICSVCTTTACSVAGDVLIAGKDINGLLYIPNYKKGGIFAPPSSGWEGTVSYCTS